MMTVLLFYLQTVYVLFIFHVLDSYAAHMSMNDITGTL